MGKSNKNMGDYFHWKMRWGQNSRLSPSEDRYFVQFAGAGDMTKEDHLKTLELLVRLLSEK